MCACVHVCTKYSFVMFRRRQQVFARVLLPHIRILLRVWARQQNEDDNPHVKIKKREQDEEEEEEEEE